MATSPLFGWEEPDDVDLVKDGAAAIRTLGNAIDTSMGDLLGGTTGQVLSKASNTNMDFTWVAQDDSNAIQNAIVDAKGDLIAASAADTPARLAVGTNDQVLTADSTAATGLKWATPATGGMTLLSTTTLSGASTTVSSIPTTYLQLYVQIFGMTNATANGKFTVQINGAANRIYASVIQDATLTGLAGGDLLSAGTSMDRTVASNCYTLIIDHYYDTSVANFCPIQFYGTTYVPSYQATSTSGSFFSAGSPVTSIKFLNTGGNFSSGTVLVYGVK